MLGFDRGLRPAGGVAFQGRPLWSPATKVWANSSPWAPVLVGGDRLHHSTFALCLCSSPLPKSWLPVPLPILTQGF